MRPNIRVATDMTSEHDVAVPLRLPDLVQAAHGRDLAASL